MVLHITEKNDKERRREEESGGELRIDREEGKGKNKNSTVSIGWGVGWVENVQ